MSTTAPPNDNDRKESRATKKDPRVINWSEVLRPYSQPSVARSVWQIVNSLVPYVGLWYLAYLALDYSYWATLGIAVVASGFLIRLFIVSHDCGHGSFFRSERANQMVGAFLNIFVFVPYAYWRYEHALHHGASGDLDHRGVGDVETLTVEEYLAASKWERFKYRLYRNPFVMFVVGPLYVFLINYRFYKKNAPSSVKRSVVNTNLVLAGLVVVMHFTIGLKAFFLVQFPIIAIAGCLGVWLFYVQHQFEGVYWERHEDWDYVRQAMEGSSFFKLPKVLQWFSGNIGFHHIHHLSHRIPNYNLERVQREVALFDSVPEIGFWRSFKSLTFRLYDEENRQLVGFSHLKKLRN